MVAHDPHPCPELRGFQRDLLAVVAGDGPHKGLDLKSELEERWAIRISRSRLYSNMNALIERGLIEKSELTGRANHYEITAPGEHLLRAYATWIAENVKIDIFGTTISEEAKRCTEFTADHGLTQPPTDRFCFGVVCPHPGCEMKTPVLVDSPAVVPPVNDCLRCQRPVILDRAALEQFATEVRTNE
ncbi:PadR family transcriptional regulator [Halocatena marina]|uniref:PadR family transcriptional regulator n=1 Tax=Halocatena marina TaxID=2934937 RepID=A0ABD5YYK8_9EURY|nr:helix-turn-helix transcriptional regulator [Halocatena marina]